MGHEMDKWLEEAKEERLKGIKEAKAALFAYLAAAHPSVTRISASYSGSGDEGWVDEVRYYGANDEPAELRDEKLGELVEHVFDHVTPVGFENNEGGEGEIHIYPAALKVVVQHTFFCPGLPGGSPKPTRLTVPLVTKSPLVTVSAPKLLTVRAPVLLTVGACAAVSAGPTDRTKGLGTSEACYPRFRFRAHRHTPSRRFSAAPPPL
jgi:hypothetical protein